MRYVWPALKRLGAWIARQFKKKIMKWILKALGLYILGEALMKIWKGISRDDLPMSERREQGREGLFMAATTIIAEWNMIKNLFRLGKGYQEFKKIAELLGNVKLASRLVNLAKGDLALAMELAQMMKPSQLESILPFVDDAIELKNTLGLLGNDVLKLESMLVKCTNLTEVNKIISMAGGDALLAERLLAQVGEGKKLIALLQRVPDAKKLSQLLEITPDVAALSDDALNGLLKMTDDELAALSGKSTAEIEAAGKASLNAIDFSNQVVNAATYIQEGRYIEGVTKIDLMGGTTTKFGNDFVNIDIAAERGIIGSSTDLSKFIPPNSVQEIIVNNPFNPTIKNPFELFLNDCYLVLKGGGTIRINGQMQNPLFKKISKEACEELGFEVLEFRGSLPNEFAGVEYFTTQGSKINPSTMTSILLKKK